MPSQLREAPCAHCRATVQYPADDVGMPVTCPSCGLSFDAPEGKLSPVQAPRQLKTLCPNCQQLLEYLPDAAGNAVACPTCSANIRLPGGGAAAAAKFLDDGGTDKDNKKKPRVKSAVGGGGVQGIIRGKKGFGSAIVGPVRSGPRMTKEGDPHLRYKIVSGLVLLGVGAGLALGLYLIANKQRHSEVDRVGLLQRLAEEYIRCVNHDDARGLAAMCAGDPGARIQEFENIFKKVSIRIDEYKIKEAFENGNHGVVVVIWNYGVRDNQNQKTERVPARENTLEFRFSTKDNRWNLSKAWIFGYQGLQ